MKERPILFSALMVRAILDGRKTQTRRVLKNQPEIIKDPFPTTDEVKGVFKFKESTGIYQCLGMQNLIETCPYGQPGDRLWVRESWSTHACLDNKKPSELINVNSYHYWADGEINTGKKRPSIHMPRWASRINLEITGIRVERLQDISEDDAKAEGVSDDMGIIFKTGDDTPIGMYGELWESINGQGSWAFNPWVWVLEFKRC
jgi:hypothetical protein